MQIKVCDIRRGLQHRAINEPTVLALMESFPVSGQISPIIVKEAGIMRERLESGYLLIAGNHRLTAAERLEWETIEADIWPADTNAVRLEMIEVDENLCRAELSTAEKAKALKKRKILWESLKAQEIGGNQVPTYRADGVKAGPQHQQGFAASTAAVTGISKRAINQYLKIAETLGDALDDIQGTELDTKPQLLKLVNTAEEVRASMLEEAMKTPEAQEAFEKSEPPPAKPLAKPKAGKDKDEDAKAKELANRIIREFNRLPEKYQQAIREAINAI